MYKLVAKSASQKYGKGTELVIKSEFETVFSEYKTDKRAVTTFTDFDRFPLHLNNARFLKSASSDVSTRNSEVKDAIADYGFELESVLTPAKPTLYSSFGHAHHITGRSNGE